MAENQDGQEKSEDPSSKRLSDAREKGQIARSRELNTVVLTLLGGAALMLMAQEFSAGFQGVMRDSLALTREDIFEPMVMIRHLSKALTDTALMLMPFLGLMLVLAILASMALGGVNLSTQALAPKFSRISPLSGFKRMFSMRSLVELVKALIKFLLVGSAAVWLLWDKTDELLALDRMEVKVALSGLGDMVGWAFLFMAASLLLVMAVDVPFQLWDHRRQLMMTKQEVKDERKQTDGNPEIRGRIRSMQREMAFRRMMAEVPKADVVVTNPTHYAVALRYDQQRMGAPQVVAKGVDLVARNIRKTGVEHGVPIVEAPTLARAIYHSTDLGGLIPQGLYLAVAKLLAYVFQLKAYRRTGNPLPPVPDFPVPEDLRK